MNDDPAMIAAQKIFDRWGGSYVDEVVPEMAEVIRSEYDRFRCDICGRQVAPWISEQNTFSAADGDTVTICGPTCRKRAEESGREPWDSCDVCGTARPLSELAWVEDGHPDLSPRNACSATCAQKLTEGRELRG